MKIDIDKIINVLQMVERMQPGMTVVQLIELIQSRRTELETILKATGMM